MIDLSPPQKWYTSLPELREIGGTKLPPPKAGHENWLNPQKNSAAHWVIVLKYPSEIWCGSAHWAVEKHTLVGSPLSRGLSDFAKIWYMSALWVRGGCAWIEIHIHVPRNPWWGGGRSSNYQSLDRYNSAADYSISIKFGTAFDHCHSRYTRSVQGQWLKGQSHMLNAHQSPKYPYSRGHRGRRIQRRLQKCWMCRLVLLWAS